MQLKKMKIYIDYEPEVIDDHQVEEFRRTIGIIMDRLGLPQDAELSVMFTDDKRMREFNRDYRSYDRTTDVLSFPQGFGERNSLLGDVLISVDTARRQAEKYSLTLDEEITRLLIHGILHLLGYDHKHRVERTRMREKEKKLLEYITEG